MLSKIIYDIFELYWWLIIINVFLTWIPNINWNNQPFKFIKQAVDPYLYVFSKTVSPIGGIDFSPLFAIVILKVLQGWITKVLSYFGL